MITSNLFKNQQQQKEERTTQKNRETLNGFSAFFAGRGCKLINRPSATFEKERQVQKKKPRKICFDRHADRTDSFCRWSCYRFKLKKKRTLSGYCCLYKQRTVGGKSNKNVLPPTHSVTLVSVQSNSSERV